MYVVHVRDIVFLFDFQLTPWNVDTLSHDGFEKTVSLSMCKYCTVCVWVNARNHSIYICTYITTLFFYACEYMYTVPVHVSVFTELGDYCSIHMYVYIHMYAIQSNLDYLYSRLYELYIQMCRTKENHEIKVQQGPRGRVCTFTHARTLLCWQLCSARATLLNTMATSKSKTYSKRIVLLIGDKAKIIE